MGGGTTTQSGTSTSVNQIPQWMSDAGQQNYAYAQQVAEQPLQQYQGPMVAEHTSPQTPAKLERRRKFVNNGADPVWGRDLWLSRRAGAEPGERVGGRADDASQQSRQRCRGDGRPAVEH